MTRKSSTNNTFSLDSPRSHTHHHRKILHWRDRHVQILLRLGARYHNHPRSHIRTGGTDQHPGETPVLAVHRTGGRTLLDFVDTLREFVAFVVSSPRIGR